MQKRAINARFYNFIRFYLQFRSDGNREAVPFPLGGRTARPVPRDLLTILYACRERSRPAAAVCRSGCFLL